MIHWKSEKEHERILQKLQHTLKDGHGHFSLFPSSTPSNTLRNGEYKASLASLDLSSLNTIISINLEEKWVKVEPRMTVHALCKELLPYGVMLPVTPEFSSITVGGAIMGAALESSSYRYGQFNDACLEYELLLGNGTLLTVSPQEYPELFYAITGSYGTLAILTLVKIQLIPIKKHVRVHYQQFDEKKLLIEFFRKEMQRQEVDFLDGIGVSNNCWVGIKGILSDDHAGLPVFKSTPWSPWFYQHVTQVAQKGSYEEVLPLQHYLFRLDRGAFWMGRFLLRPSLLGRAFLRMRLSNIVEDIRAFAKTLGSKDNPSFFFRLLFNHLFSSHSLYRIWHAVPRAISEQLFFIQDFYAPLEKAEETLSLFIQKTDIFPIWLCPIKGTSSPQFLSPHYGKSSYLNLGFYGVPTSSTSVPALTAELEEAIFHFGGRKMLYSLTYYSQELFSKIYDTERYRELRKKYYADEVFLPLYNKVANVL